MKEIVAASGSPRSLESMPGFIVGSGFSSFSPRKSIWTKFASRIKRVGLLCASAARDAKKQFGQIYKRTEIGE